MKRYAVRLVTGAREVVVDSSDLFLDAYDSALDWAPCHVVIDDTVTGKVLYDSKRRYRRANRRQSR